MTQAPVPNPAQLTPAEVLAPDVVIQRNVMVAMRDGVRLATDIYLPARNGRPLGDARPVIFERTPYDKAGTPRHPVVADDVVILNSGRVAHSGPVSTIGSNEQLLEKLLGIY